MALSGLTLFHPARQIQNFVGLGETGFGDGASGDWHFCFVPVLGKPDLQF
jgi:hypothetical protein